MDEMIVTLWSMLTGFVPAEYLGLVGAVVLFANTITAFVATRSDIPALDIVLRVLNVLSINVGKNKNADG